MQELYIVGFGFSSDWSRVVAIRKNRPSPIAGLLCGPGGLYEPGVKDKDVFHAMAREFEEETSVKTTADDWRYISNIKGRNGKPVALFWAQSDEFLKAMQTTDEEVFVLNCSDLLKRNDTVEVFHEIVEMVMRGDGPLYNAPQMVGG